MGKLEEVTTTNFSKSQIITTRLESYGINCYLKFIGNDYSFIASKVKIFVDEDSLDKAKVILHELQSEFTPVSSVVVDIEAFSGLYIVPVDFSNASINACFYALRLAYKFKSSLKLIHTYGLPEIRPMSFDDTDFYTGTLTSHLNELKQEAEDKINKLILDLNQYCADNKLGEIPISVSIVNGLPDEITIYTAELEMAGLIIMGISKKDVRTFEPVGKIASKIVEKASCPVLIIPEDSVSKEIDIFKNVLYTTAFDEMDFAAIQKLLGFIKRLKSKIHILHISNEEGDPWDNIKMEGLREYFAKAYSYNDVFCDLIYSEDILKALDTFLQVNSVDIISMVTHKRNLIWKLINPSITKKIMYHTRIPLLVFHS